MLKDEKPRELEDAEFGEDDLILKKSNAQLESSSFKGQRITFAEKNFDNKLTENESDDK